MMIHQPNSLDSIDGDQQLPYDSVPIRLEHDQEKQSYLWLILFMIIISISLLSFEICKY